MNRISRPNPRMTLILATILALVTPILLQTPVFAAAVNFYYERVIRDSSGNEIGSQKTRITSLSSLPSGSPWRTYMSQWVGNQTMWEYSQSLGQSLSAPLNITMSDKDYTSSSSKNSSGYNIKLYKHVTQYSSDSSKKFVFLHEVGHIGMLNSYPSSYNFSGLDYGSDNTHYMDEILPNENTAWVEGWANAFAALNNGGKVFSLSLNSDSVTSFLSGNTFEQMGRNELFCGKMVYDMINTLPSGRDKVFNVLSSTGPQYSLRAFIQSYLKVYPGDRVAIAKLLDKNGFGKASLAEMLAYVNNGSYTVSNELYSYLNQRGSINNTGTGTGTTTKKTGFWAKIGNFFSNLFAGLFGNKDKSTASQSASKETYDGLPWGEVLMTTESDLNQASSPIAQETLSTVGSGDLSKAQEEYFAAFGNYNDIVKNTPNDTQAVKKALTSMKEAKANFDTIRRAIQNRAPRQADSD